MPNIFKKNKKGTKREQLLSPEYINFLLSEQRSREPKNIYEKLCRFGGTLGIRPPKSIEENLQKNIIFSSLNVSPTDVFSTSITSFIVLTLLIIASSFFLFSLKTVLLLMFVPLVISYLLYSYPSFQAQVTKIQTGDESIKIVLYMVIYLKLHPSFEGAVNFASGRVKGPITNDIKKIMWDIQMGKFKTVEEGLSAYMPKWAIWNEDFVRSLSLLYGVLSEPTETAREHILKKSLSYLLTTTERKMKTYVEDIAGPINILHIMGMLLPVVGLIMFPIVSMFMHESVNPMMIGVGYTIILPLLLYFFMNRILLKRPSAFMVPDISKHPALPPLNMFRMRIGKRQFFIPILPLSIFIGLLVMVYGIFHFVDLYSSLAGAAKPIQEKLLKQEAEISIANLASTFSITFGFGSMVFLYFYLRSFQRIEIRNQIKDIEAEFQVGLFSLGNYLSEGYPLEKALQKSLEEYKKLGMEKRPTFFFFSKLLYNIKNLGMSFERAVFDKESGIIFHFPSVLIEEIMRILSDASKRSSVLLGSISKTIGSYLEDLSTIEAKIRELLEDVRGGIKIQSTFIVPLICAITGSLGIFILNMLKMLSCQLQQIEKILGIGTFGVSTGTGSLLNQLLGDFTRVIPMTTLQVIVGVYTVEIVTLFAILLNGIENGFDRTSRDYLIFKTLIQAIALYVVVSVLSLILFHAIIMSIIETAPGATFVCD